MVYEAPGGTGKQQVPELRRQRGDFTRPKRESLLTSRKTLKWDHFLTSSLFKGGGGCISLTELRSDMLVLVRNFIGLASFGVTRVS